MKTSPEDLPVSSLSPPCPNEAWKRWRFIPPIAASAHFQIAADDWLWHQHQQGNHPPVLRFYTWEPAAISLGFHQRRWPEHWQHLRWQDKPLDLVRRPTGGRAVLHQGDLTYAIVTSGLTGSRSECYQYLCEFLRQGWRSLGLELAYGQSGRGYMHQPNCFSTATSADLILPDGYKLIGSAQAWCQGTVLQHGSMRLSLNLELHQQVFRESTEVMTKFELPDCETAIAALVKAVQQHFQIELEPQPLSPTEIEQIRYWQRTRLASPGNNLALE
jgi:lipoate---protein ligase